MTDPRELPAYSVAEAASYLDMPVATLRSWVLGRTYETSAGRKQFQPLLDLADKKLRCLSFYNLIEAFTLNSMRRTDHHISIPNIRKALDYVKRQTKEKRPLLTERFLTDGVDLFLDKYGELVAVTKDGQLAIRAVVIDSLRHVRRDSKGMPSKLYLFAARAAKQAAAEVVIDPRISFGNPIVDGTGISTAILAQRYKAGDSIDELADDFGLSRNAVEQAIRYEVIPYEEQLRQLTFFLDRNLGSKRVAEALRNAGARVEVHGDHFLADGTDEEWLSACGKHGWIAITLDYRIRYRASERDTLREQGVKAFLIARAGEMSGNAVGQLLVAKLPKLAALATQTPAPFAFRMTPSGAITKVPLKRS